MIYPAESKRATDDPHFTAYDYLGKCLENAKTCLVIGYSFRDYDTLMKFKAASLNANLRVLVLDPDAKNICSHLEANDIVAEAIPYKFGLNESDYLQSIRAMVHKAASGVY